MNYKNILVLTDFSKDSQKAVRSALEFAQKYEAKMTILHVLQDETHLSFVLSDSEYHNLTRKLEKQAAELFEQMDATTPGLREFSYTRKLRTGIPYISCLYEIENGQYDLVFAGSHGKSDLKHIFLGSTAEKVLRRSPISVFMTRR